MGDLTEADGGFFPFLPLEQTSTLKDAVVLLGNYRVRRLPIIDDAEGDLINIVTQSSVVARLAELMGDPELEAHGAKSLTEAGLDSVVKLHCVRTDQPVREAFKLIREFVGVFRSRRQQGKGVKGCSLLQLFL